MFFRSKTFPVLFPKFPEGKLSQRLPESTEFSQSVRVAFLNNATVEFRSRRRFSAFPLQEVHYRNTVHLYRAQRVDRAAPVKQHAHIQRCITLRAVAAAPHGRFLHRENLMRHHYHKIMVSRGVMTDYENIDAMNLRDTRCLLYTRARLFIHCRRRRCRRSRTRARFYCRRSTFFLLPIYNERKMFGICDCNGTVKELQSGEPVL